MEAGDAVNGKNGTHVFTEQARLLASFLPSISKRNARFEASLHSSEIRSLKFEVYSSFRFLFVKSFSRS